MTQPTIYNLHSEAGKAQPANSINFYPACPVDPADGTGVILSNMAELLRNHYVSILDIIR